ncbi:MAG: radical SAM/SPASM domain-containing protein, partial [Candidatus Hodarchaeota archaeon]
QKILYIFFIKSTQMKLRTIKDFIAIHKILFSLALFLINLPIIGNIYDYFYFKRVRARVNANNLRVIIEPNNICNLRCIVCPYQKMTRKKETMPLDLFKKIVDQSIALGCKVIQLQQYNEPFTDKDIFKRISYIRSKGAEVYFYSNGTILDKTIRDKILEHPPNLIRFSIDGIEKKSYESIRVGANYEKVVSNVIKLFKERNKHGLREPIIEVCSLLLDNTRDQGQKYLNFWRNKCDNASVYPSDSRLEVSYSYIKYKKMKPYPCFNPHNIVVLSNGKVCLCCVDYDGEVIFGDLNKQNLKDIINSKKVKEIYESHLKRKCNLEICKKCSRLYVDSAFYWWDNIF